MHAIARVLVLPLLVAVSVVIGPGAGAGDRPGLVSRWSAATRGEPSFLLADADGAVAISQDGRVTAFDPKGSERWSADVGDGRAVVFQDLPSLGGGLVVVPANEEHAVALDRRTGVERWRVPFPVHSTGAGVDGTGAPVAALVDRSGTVLVVDGASGATRWSVQLPDFEDQITHVWFGAGHMLVQWTPVVPGSRFAAFDVATGAVVWSRENPGASLPSVVDDSVLFVEMLRRWSDTTPNPARVQSLDLATGVPHWTRDIETRTVYFTYAASAVGGTSFAIVDLAGEIRLFDKDDGTERWQRATRRKQYEAEPRIAGDVVAMSTYGTGLLAFSALDGKPVDTAPIGRVQYGVTIEATAAVGNRLYLLVSPNGAVRDEGEVWAIQAIR